MGQTPAHCRASPSSSKPSPAIAIPCSFCFLDRLLLSHSPVSSPRIIVPSVGMKLRVDQPPWLKTNGCSLGKRLRNQTSNAHERFEFLFQCAKNPVKLCSQFGRTPTRA